MTGEDHCYTEYLSLMESNSVSGYVDRSGSEPESVIDDDVMTELDTKLFRDKQMDYDEYSDLE